MTSVTTTPILTLGDVTIQPTIDNGLLHSLGTVQVGGVDLRNPATRFLPWFDSFEGDVFRRFAVQEIVPRDDTWVIATRAISDPDVMFRERRDSSGDLCFRNASWDDQPLEADLRICLAPATTEIDGLAFTGFKYWFEYQSDAVPIHRFVDRQTWEVGGNLDDVTLLLRSWITPPRMRIGRDTVYSTVGLDHWAKLLPGNLWARWTLLPSFDLQYGADGVLLAWFDQISLIRTVIESNAGEDCLRVIDMHCFEQSHTVSTNPKTVLYAPTQLGEVDALNFWTRVYDMEAEKACRQFGISEGPAGIVFSHNVWRNIRFDTTYEHVLDVAEEFGADYVFIDAIWEHQQALHETLEEIIPAEHKENRILQKLELSPNMCITLDFEVAEILGGEEGLKALCDRARAKGIKIISWMAAHMSPNSQVSQRAELGHGGCGIFAAKESGRHPDTGHPPACWTLNLNTPIYEHLREQVLGVCRRTGLAGYLWDSVSNMGWWQIDYSDGSMRPQYDKMAQMYADLTQAGLYILPEGILTFSNQSCCGLHGGNIYAGDLLGYSYNTSIGFWFGSGEHGIDTYDAQLIKGLEPIDVYFQCIAHKRIPSLQFHMLPREEWDPERVQQIKDILKVYKTHRHLMQRRTVLPDDAGVLWENDTDVKLLFSFRDQSCPLEGSITDALTDECISDGLLQANRAYLIH